MITQSKFSFLVWSYISESKDRRYRHRLIKLVKNKRNELISELKTYIQKAHQDAKDCLRKSSVSLDPLGDTETDYLIQGYPEELPIPTSRGYFGEVFAGLIAEHYAPFDIDTWKVPVFLFRFHEAAFQYLEELRQTGKRKKSTLGRTGDDCLAFQCDDQGQIVRTLYCEAKCLKRHNTEKVADAHEKVSESVLVDIPQLIRIFRESSDPDASQWLNAMYQLLSKLPLSSDERYDLVSYICNPPTRTSQYLPIDKPHPSYTASRRLEAVEIHFPDAESVIREVYGITDTIEDQNTEEYADEEEI
jgi:hypothetical protein